VDTTLLLDLGGTFECRFGLAGGRASSFVALNCGSTLADRTEVGFVNTVCGSTLAEEL
jgi:hypothetical protein